MRLPTQSTNSAEHVARDDNNSNGIDVSHLTRQIDDGGDHINNAIKGSASTRLLKRVIFDVAVLLMGNSSTIFDLP